MLHGPPSSRPHDPAVRMTCKTRRPPQDRLKAALLTPDPRTARQESRPAVQQDQPVPVPAVRRTRRERRASARLPSRPGGRRSQLPAVCKTRTKAPWRVIDPPMYSLLFLAAVIHDAAYGGHLRASDDSSAARAAPFPTLSRNRCAGSRRGRGFAKAASSRDWPEAGRRPLSGPPQSIASAPVGRDAGRPGSPGLVSRKQRGAGRGAPVRRPRASAVE